MSDYYDKQGKPISMHEWAKLFEDYSYRRILLTFLSGVPGFEVSTVWLGLDHGWRTAQPLIFESMVFCHTGDEAIETMERYSTLEEAVAGHQRLVDKYRSLNR